MPPNRQEKHAYNSVGGEEEDSMGTSYDPIRKPFFKSNLFTIICLLLALISTTASGFFAGILYGERHKRHGQSTHVSDHYPHDIVKLDPVTVKFTSNRAFLQRPSNETEELWKTLYPKDTHGLFEYPDEIPERSGFAAFHQLHCVDALRRGYYQREDRIAALRSHDTEPEFEHDVDEDHTLHCIEFLRQSIMCHADTTLQTEAVYHQGILAFGVQYQCRNWWQLVEWVDKRNEEFRPKKH